MTRVNVSRAFVAREKCLTVAFVICRSWKFDQYPRSTAHCPLIKILDHTVPSGRSWICRTQKERYAMSLLLLRCIIVALVVSTSRAYPPRDCKPVPAFCRNLTDGDSYTHMRLPNAFNNYQLKETEDAIRPWKPLVGTECHPGLKLFLCAIYAPICLHDKESGLKVSIELCRSFCSMVREKCEPEMNRYNYTWPTHSAFNCSQYVDDSMCVREDFAAATTPPTGIDAICDPNLNTDAVLQDKACNSDLVLRAEVTSMREAKGQSSSTMLKIKRHKKSGKSGMRNSRKAKDSPDRVLVQHSGCRNLSKRVKKDQTYLIILDKKSGSKKTKYMVKAIVSWNKRYRKVLKRNNCRRR